MLLVLFEQLGSPMHALDQDNTPEVIDRPIEEVQRELGIPSAEAHAFRASDLLTLGPAVVAATVLTVATTALALTPVTLVAWVLAYRAYRRSKLSAVTE